MKNLILCLAVAACGMGCNASQLQFTTLRQSRTIPDLQQKQVMENFARLSADAGLLPYFDLVSVGTSAVTDRGAASFTLASAVKEFTSGEYGGEAAREISGNWTISPTNDPNRLAAMRAAYMIAMGRENEIAAIDRKRLHDFLILNYDDYKATNDPHSVIPSGWLCVGDKASRPKGGHYVSHWGGVYVWVKEGRLRDLANFSLIILDIATLRPPGPARGTAEKVTDPKPEEPAAKEGENLISSIREAKLQNQAQVAVARADIASLVANKTVDDVPQRTARVEELEKHGRELDAELVEAIKSQREFVKRAQENADRRAKLLEEQIQQQPETSNIPDRLNGPAFNQGLFLLPR